MVTMDQLTLFSGTNTNDHIPDAENMTIINPMNTQPDLFTQQLPTPPKWLQDKIHQTITHTDSVLVYRENKGLSAASCAYFFTGDAAGKAMEITPELERALTL